MKVTTEIKAFLSDDSSVTPDQLMTPKGLARCSFFTSDMSKYGFTYVGQATVTVDVPDLKTLVENKVDALRSQASEIRATATAKCTEIEGKIQQLLAIDYTPSE